MWDHNLIKHFSLQQRSLLFDLHISSHNFELYDMIELVLFHIVDSSISLWDGGLDDLNNGDVYT